MTTTTQTATATTIEHVNSRRVRVKRDGRAQDITWTDLRAAAEQDDKTLAAAYREILVAAEQRAIRVAHDVAFKRFAACQGHYAARTATYGFTGTVRFASPSRQMESENRAAHGAVRHDETCTCGAVRQTNSNGRHQEVGDWMAQTVTTINHALPLL